MYPDVVHVYPCDPTDPTLDLEHDPQDGACFVRHLAIDDCVLCREGRCAQRIDTVRQHLGGRGYVAIHGVKLDS